MLKENDGVPRLENKENNVLETSKGSMGKRVVEALVKLWREKGHLGVITS